MNKAKFTDNFAGLAGGGVYALKESTRQGAVGCTSCTFKSNSVSTAGIGGSWVTDKQDGSAGGQFIVDLSLSTFVGPASDAAVCGNLTSPAVTSSPILPSDQLEACSSARAARCLDYCGADKLDIAGAP